MKTKNRKPKEENQPQPGPTLADPTPPPADPPTERLARLQLPLKEDGSFDLEGMRATTIEKLKAAIASTSGLYSPTVPGVGSTTVVFSPVIYGILGTVESLLAQRMAKIPKEIADSVFKYTPQELELVGPPTDRIIAKYSNEWMLKYADELTLAGLLASMTIAKVNAAIMLSKASQGESGPNSKKNEDTPQVIPN